MIVKSGRTMVRELLRGDSTVGITHVGFGTGTTGETDNDTALSTEIKKYNTGTRYPVLARPSTLGVSHAVVVEHTLTSLDLNGSALAECGLFNNSTTGTMFCRETPTSISKANTFELQYVYSIKCIGDE